MNQFYLMTSFIVGFVILSIEIITAKILSPIFGTGLFVWTSSITVTMLALSIGYYIGAKKSKNKKIENQSIYHALILSSFFILFSTYILRKLDILYLILPLWMGTMLATMSMIFIPLVMMGMLSPVLVNNSTNQENNQVGWNAGLLSLFGSVGSLLGALCSGFILLQFLSYKQIIWANAFLLLGISLFYFIQFQKKVIYLFLLVPFAILLPQKNNLQEKENEDFKVSTLDIKDGAYGEVRVLHVLNKKSENVTKMMLLDGMPQGISDKNNQSSTAYHYLIQSIIYEYAKKKSCDKKIEILFIGIGAGMIPKNLENESCFKLSLVDINPNTSEFAKIYFKLQSEIVIQDGRQFIKNNPNQYDVIVMDIFNGESIPSHMLTQEFMKEISMKMNHDGLLLLNVIGSPQDEASNIMKQTILSQFKHLSMIALNNDEENINFIFYAAHEEFSTDIQNIQAYIIKNDKQDIFKKFDHLKIETIKKIKYHEIFTDDFNHFDQLTMVKKQSLRKEMMPFLLSIQ